MKDEIQKSLDEVILEEIRRISEMETGSKEKESAVDNLSDLYKLRIEEAKIEQAKRELRQKDFERVQDDELKRAQLESQRLDRIVNAAIQGGTVIGGWLLYSTLFHEGLKFEQFGTIRTPWMRNLISKIMPKR